MNANPDYNDALEADLYILRDQLRSTPADEPASL
jgi:hypothetical protein